MRFTTETIIACYHHYLHITFIITKVLELLNKFTYKHTIIFYCPKAVNHHIYIILHHLNHTHNKDIPTRLLQRIFYT